MAGASYQCARLIVTAPKLAWDGRISHDRVARGELKVEDLHLKVSELDPTMKMFCVTDHLTQFVATIDDAAVSGDGLFEFAAIGPHEQYGFTDYTDTA